MRVVLTLMWLKQRLLLWKWPSSCNYSLYKIIHLRKCSKYTYTGTLTIYSLWLKWLTKATTTMTAVMRSWWWLLRQQERATRVKIQIMPWNIVNLLYFEENYSENGPLSLIDNNFLLSNQLSNHIVLLLLILIAWT